MPVDEWCDQRSGCGSPGVNDDPQMNGASVAALKFAVEAAEVLGETPEPAWVDIGNKLLIPRGTLTTPLGVYKDVHLMPNGTGPSVLNASHLIAGCCSHTGLKSCNCCHEDRGCVSHELAVCVCRYVLSRIDAVPFGTVMFGGLPFDKLSPGTRKANPTAGSASVCPEDVMYLSYPMGPALNISSDMTQRDLDAWIGSGMTCLENGGMTHPIRLISFLIAQDHNASYHRLAEQALNGTMYRLRSEFNRASSTSI